jgi:hypothetical protein
MRRKGIATQLALCAIAASVMSPSRLAAQSLGHGAGSAARPNATEDATVRVVGPNSEHVPVLNVGGATLKLHVEGANHATVPANGWHTDSPSVAAVDGTGTVTPNGSGFATVYAETGQGEAKCFVAVMRVTSRTGAMVQGDTKADTSGNVYLSDPVHHVIVRASGTSVGAFAGSAGHPGFHDDRGTATQFNEPTGLGVDLSTNGGLYVADTLNHCIRRVGFDGQVGTERKSSVVVGQPESPGTMSGDGPFPIDRMQMNGPQGAVSVGGNLYITDTENHCLWYADVARGMVYLLAGRPGASGMADGMGSQARFNRPTGLSINARGNLLVLRGGSSLAVTR